MRSLPPQAAQASVSDDEADSQLGQPAVSGRVPETPSPAAMKQPSSASLEIARARHVLLVDDDPSIVRSLSRVLRARGYLTSTASNLTI